MNAARCKIAAVPRNASPWLVAGLVVVALTACTAERTELPSCEWTATTEALLQRLDAERWLGWLRKLSGAESVTVGGEVTTILTRNTRAMASGSRDARAFEWVHEQVQARFPADAIDVQEFREHWRNLTVTHAGTDLAHEVILVVAHLDSLVGEGAEDDPAPGADDDATGVAVLLELATLLPDAALRRTVRLAFVTGEEQGLVGCEAWIDAHETAELRAVVNLDELGWDGSGDRTLQVHVDDTPESVPLLDCVAAVTRAYALDLSFEPRVGALAMGNSCQSSFWHRGVPAAWISENMVEPGPLNPFVHTAADTVDNLTRPYAFDMARAAVASVLSLAEPMGLPE